MDFDLGLTVGLKLIHLLIFIESEWEHRLLGKKMKDVGSSSVWTSGHICDGSVSDRKGRYIKTILKFLDHYSEKQNQF